MTDPQVTYEELITELRSLNKGELVMYVRSYVQERTPAAFAAQPMLWEAVREWVASRLAIHPREFGLSGSAQSGFSLAKMKRGNAFNPLGSDLDMFAVNGDCFSKMETEARLFSIRNADHGDFIDQSATVSKQLKMDYLDLNQVPANHERYPTIATARNDASIVIDRLSLHGFKLKPSHFRVYKDWTALSNWVRRSYANL